jgi:hypothetical protein
MSAAIALFDVDVTRLRLVYTRLKMLEKRWFGTSENTEVLNWNFIAGGATRAVD